MIGNRVLIVTSLAVFLVALTALVPAQVALRGLASDSIKPFGASGTFWRGSVTGAAVGAVRLGETTWRVSAPALLLGRLAADVETHIGESLATGSVAVTMTGNLICSACRFEGPLASLKPLSPALRSLTGRLELDIATLEIQDRWPARAVGSAKLSGVPIAAAGTAPSAGVPLSGFEASFSANPVSADGLIEIALQDSGGPVELKARLALTPPGNFAMAGSAKARNDAPADIASALSALGRTGPDGSTQVSLSGTF